MDVAIGQIMYVIGANYDARVDSFEVKIEAFGNCFGTVDFVEGTTAFLEKRKADFSGK